MENHQFERLLHEIVELREHTDEGLQELREHTDAGLQELRGGLQEVRGDLQELRRDAWSWVDDAKRHFEILVEDVRGDVRLVAEGVVAVNERVDRLEIRMDERFEETNALIRLSYRDLDRRVTTLEGSAPS